MLVRACRLSNSGIDTVTPMELLMLVFTCSKKSVFWPDELLVPMPAFSDTVGM